MARKRSVMYYPMLGYRKMAYNSLFFSFTSRDRMKRIQKKRKDVCPKLFWSNTRHMLRPPPIIELLHSLLTY